MGVTERERLMQSEARFHALVEAVNDYAIFLLDDEGRIISWNPGARRIKGYAEDEILNRHFSIFYLPEDVAAGKPAKELQIASVVGRYEVEGWRLRKDGSRFLASVLITPVRDEDGEIVGYAKVTRDMTEKHLEQERENLIRILEERERIARRIHEGAITTLFGVGMELQALAVRSNDPQNRARLDGVVANVDEAIRQLRSFVFHPGPEDPPAV
jgi:PAS domain S-box-containing protein